MTFLKNDPRPCATLKQVFLDRFEGGVQGGRMGGGGYRRGWGGGLREGRLGGGGSKWGNSGWWWGGGVQVGRFGVLGGGGAQAPLTSPCPPLTIPSP